MTNLYNSAAQHITSGARGKDIGNVLAAVQSLRDGTVTFNAEARKGKGTFRGADKVAQSLFDAGLGEEMSMSGVKGDVSKALVVVRIHLAHLVADETLSDDTIEIAVTAWRRTSGAVSGLYAAATKDENDDDDKEPRTLAAMVAAMLAEARKNGHEPSAIVEEVQAQLTA